MNSTQPLVTNVSNFGVYTIIAESEMEVMQVEKEQHVFDQLKQEYDFITGFSEFHAENVSLSEPLARSIFQNRIDACIHAPVREEEFVDVECSIFQPAQCKIQSGLDDIMLHVNNYFRAHGITEQDISAKTEHITRMICNAIETFNLARTFLAKAETWFDYWSVFLMVYKLLTGNVVSDMIESLKTAKEWIQSLAEEIINGNIIQGFSDDLAFLRDGFSTYKKVKKSLLMKNSSRLLKYCLSFGLFAHAGLTFKNCQYTEAEERYVKEKFSSKQSFIEEVIDGTLYFLQRAAQAWELKSWSPFLYDSASLAAWSDKAFEVKNHYRMFTANNNPEVTYSSILNELTSLIEQGKVLEKIQTSDPTAAAVFKRMNLDLKFMYCELTSTNANQKTRRPPFAELVVGNSSVGKSLFTEVLSVHYARLRGLNEGSEFVYHRSPSETHWNGYRPFMHTIVYDDIGANNPKKVMGVDVGISELVPVINGNPTGANMADLESKGHSPIRPEHVIVNSNVEDLHADVYYAFPMALRRRLPYIIRVSPRVDTKRGIDYRNDASPSMLDPRKLEPLMPGEYPNQWNIHVKHVIAVQGEGDSPPRVGFNDMHTFNDIYEFLHWYNDVVEEHNRMSIKMEQTVDTMRDPCWKQQWCEHKLPKNNCQFCMHDRIISDNDIEGPEEISSDDGYYSSDEGSDVESEQVIESPFAQTLGEIFGPDEDDGDLFSDSVAMVYFLAQDWIRKIQAGVAKIADIACTKVKAIVISQIKTVATKYIRKVGSQIWEKIVKSSPLRWFLYALPIVTTFVAMSGWLRSADEPVQGPVSSKYGERSTLAKDGEKNPWYANDFHVATADVPQLTASWKGKDLDEIQRLLSPNIIALNIKGSNGETLVSAFDGIHALCLGGHLFVTNNHLIPNCETLELHIVHGCDESGININKDETLGQSNLLRMPDNDLVFFELHIPPRQDLRGLLPKADFRVQCEGMYLKRDSKGFVSSDRVRAVRQESRVHPTLSQQPMCEWIGATAIPTQNGDCGSVLVGQTSCGPIICGLHIAGGVTTEVESVVLNTEIVSIATKHFETPIISCNKLNLADKDKLLPLHPKSIFRYMPEGHARVYGSLPTRNTMRSHVEPTVLAPILEQHGWEMKHGAPVMKGWQPWHHAIGPVLQHTGKIRNDILRQAGDAYLNDILRQISEDTLKEVHVMDDLEAINGVPGVKYLEGLNRNSSLGYPWQRSKKFMLVALEDERWQDGVTFTDEVWNEVDRMVTDYESGKVTHPIFVGHLKDEAVEERKIIIGKTRVFLISSAAWTVIMRKWYMTFIRLFQNNKVVFEGMPGLCTQGPAWGKLRKHLTKFGEDRMFAGDFGRYDKVLESTTSMEAFRVIRKICEKAGWDELSLNILWGIAEDAIYPTALVNGDLVELEGSNPSGQAVTVILNCIVNSIYMRYVYILASPNHSAADFQDNVALATYGDDNVGGVHPSIDWFNHTVIQEELGRVGIEYTMADKKSESRPFIHIDEVEFLKRKWRYDEEVEDYFAPLNENSIKKRLMVGIVGKERTPEWKSVEDMQTSMEDYFFYGREVFEQKKSFLLSIGREAGLEHHMSAVNWPTFDDLLARWKEGSSDPSFDNV